MANIDNATPFAATLMPSCNKHGQDLLLLVVAAHFDLPRPDPDHPGGARDNLRPSHEQPLPPMADIYSGEPGLSSLLDEGQAAYTRPATDIYLRGHAVAPWGQPVQEMTAIVRVGPCALQLHIHGDRVWERSYGRGATPSKARPFTRMPLVWERAYGGVSASSNERKPAWEPRNPVGCGFETNPSAAVDRAVPNIEDPRSPLQRLSDRPTPAGTGPIARHWQPRVALAGTYDAAWQRYRAPLWPENFVPEFFNAAPPALRACPHLLGGEPVLLDGFCAEGPLRFQLPRLGMSACHHFAGLPSERSVPVLDGVQIDTDAMRLTLYYRAAIPAAMKLARHRASLLRLTRSWEQGE